MCNMQYSICKFYCSILDNSDNFGISTVIFLRVMWSQKGVVFIGPPYRSVAVSAKYLSTSEPASSVPWANCICLLARSEEKKSSGVVDAQLDLGTNVRMSER